MHASNIPFEFPVKDMILVWVVVLVVVVWVVGMSSFWKIALVLVHIILIMGFWFVVNITSIPL